LWVENIPWTATEEDVRGMFEQCGNIEKLELLTLPNGKAKGIAIVGYSMPQEAHNAIAQLNGLDMGGRPIRVRFDRFAQPQQ
jgi:RNA recognition motif-containing protein